MKSKIFKVYLVWEDESLYGVFSKYHKAKRYCRTKLKEDFSKEGHRHMLQYLTDPNYLHLYDIQVMLVDSEEIK